MLFLALLGVPFPASAQQAEVIDRTLALVSGQIITLADTQAALAFDLVEAPEPGADRLAILTGRLVDRELVLREVQRYAPPAPTEAAIDARLDQLRARVGDGAAFARALAVTGFTEARLREWIRDDLRIQSHLAQRFAAAVAPADQETAAEYARLRPTFDRAGLTAEQAMGIVRERLAAAGRRALIADWTADLRRRGDVVLLVGR